MKINIDNTEKLAIAIKEAEGRATERTVEARDIQYILNEVGDGIPKAKLHGTKVYYSGARHFAKSYKYRPNSTHWAAENIKGKWYVTDIHRDVCPNRRVNTVIEYSEEAKATIIYESSNVEF